MADVRMATGSALIIVLHDTGRPAIGSRGICRTSHENWYWLAAIMEKAGNVQSEKLRCRKILQAVSSVCRKYGGEHAGSKF